MELLSAFWIGLVCALSSSAPIGPVNFAVIQATLSHRRTAGFMVAFGGVLADILFATVAWFISDLIVGNENPELFMWINIVSIPVVLFLGFKMIRSRHDDPKAKPLRAHNKIFHGFILGVSNPGLLFYWLGAIAFAQAGGWIDDSAVSLGAFMIGVTSGIMGALTLVILGSSLLAKRVSDQLISLFTLLLGIGFIAFGIFLTGRLLWLYVF